MQWTGGPEESWRDPLRHLHSTPRRSPFQVNYGNRPLHRRYRGYLALATDGREGTGGRAPEEIAAEVARVRASGGMGETGRLRELTGYRAAGGPGAGRARPA